MSDKQINPCPICGEKRKLDVYHSWQKYFVMCGTCGYSGMRMNTPDEAVDVWNED